MIVTIYTKPLCQPCKATKRKCDQLGLPYRELPAAEHRDYLMGLGYLGAPVVEADFGDGATAHWSGYRPDFIRQLYSTLSDKMVAGKVTVPESA